MHIFFAERSPLPLGVNGVIREMSARDPALRLPGTTVIVFPLTMISKRVERGEIPDVADLFRGVVQDVREMAPEYRLNE